MVVDEEITYRPAVLIKHLVGQEETKRHSDKIVARQSLEFTTLSEEQNIKSLFLFNTEKFHVTSFTGMVGSDQRQQPKLRYFAARA